MAIHVPEGPSGGLDLVLENLALPDDEYVGYDATAGYLDVARPYPIYTSTIPALLDEKFLGAAQLTGWHYPILAGESLQGLAEIASVDPQGSSDLSYASQYDSDYAEEIQQSILGAEGLPQVKEGDYELRILRAPSLVLLAVWLHGVDDLLLPVAPAPTKLREKVAYTEDELTKALRPLALLRMEVSDREEDPLAL
jgi:hypothetical protein